MKSKAYSEANNIELVVCGEEAMGETEIQCNYHSLWKISLTFFK